MRTLEEIIVQLRPARRAGFAEAIPIRELGMFGSYARGEQTEGSDLDVIVNMGEGVGLFELAGLQQDLSDALGVKVDLVMKDALKRHIAPRILSEAVML